MSASTLEGKPSSKHLKRFQIELPLLAGCLICVFQRAAPIFFLNNTSLKLFPHSILMLSSNLHPSLANGCWMKEE
jgi:hypothetical protein